MVPVCLLMHMHKSQEESTVLTSGSDSGFSQLNYCSFQRARHFEISSREQIPLTAITLTTCHSRILNVKEFAKNKKNFCYNLISKPAKGYTLARSWKHTCVHALSRVSDQNCTCSHTFLLLPTALQKPSSMTPDLHAALRDVRFLCTISSSCDCQQLSHCFQTVWRLNKSP